MKERYLGHGDWCGKFGIHTMSSMRAYEEFCGTRAVHRVYSFGFKDKGLSETLWTMPCDWFWDRTDALEKLMLLDEFPYPGIDPVPSVDKYKHPIFESPIFVNDGFVGWLTQKNPDHVKDSVLKEAVSFALGPQDEFCSRRMYQIIRRPWNLRYDGGVLYLNCRLSWAVVDWRKADCCERGHATLLNAEI